MTRSRPTLDISLPTEPFAAQHTPRRDVRTLCRWLEGALPGGSAGIATLLERLHGPLAERRHLVAVALVVAHLRGELRGARWLRLTGTENADPRDIDREMDLVWDALARAKLVRGALRYHPGTTQHGMARFPPRLVPRWVRTNRWSLLGQDDDLLLFEPDYMEPLLRGAAEPGAARRDLARGIVAHAARDAAHAVVAAPRYAGGETLATFAPRYARWAKIARETDALEVAAYLERLASYGAPRTFDAEQALQAFRDLSRCWPAEPKVVRMREVKDGFTGSVPGTSRRPSRVHIDRETGAITRVR
ncbi:hypothetical protein [Sandaracinus amylolyticus]|uniref:Uncharacterized protein n=1 Tax=Sandaracinus amylolyticus TaxID=927083 RepID=A0A0F6VYH8_9BACT|nr:hypothetical protein [Sandaracinus amylolyticus]AKF02856.1 hypothetical protein DB32_000004 [Sandaracinus amylolyticus]AKF03348.1 hypothetical protein DB32_000497 [Sandaracinus amylolyticus]